MLGKARYSMCSPRWVSQLKISLSALLTQIMWVLTGYDMLLHPSPEPIPHQELWNTILLTSLYWLSSFMSLLRIVTSCLCSTRLWCLHVPSNPEGLLQILVDENLYAWAANVMLYIVGASSRNLEVSALSGTGWCVALKQGRKLWWSHCRHEWMFLMSVSTGSVQYTSQRARCQLSWKLLTSLVWSGNRCFHMRLTICQISVDPLKTLAPIWAVQAKRFSTSAGMIIQHCEWLEFIQQSYGVM